MNAISGAGTGRGFRSTAGALTLVSIIGGAIGTYVTWWEAANWLGWHGNYTCFTMSSWRVHLAWWSLLAATALLVAAAIAFGRAWVSGRQQPSPAYTAGLTAFVLAGVTLAGLAANHYLLGDWQAICVLPSTPV